MTSGCAVGPHFKQPPPPTVDGYTEQPLPAQTESVNVPGGQAQRYVQGMDIPGKWWELFHSKPLNDLVEKAIKANPDLDAAKAALRGAWENVYAQKGALLPSVSAGYGVTRQKVGDPLQPIEQQRQPIYPPYRSGGCGLYAGCVRRHPAADRGAQGPGRLATLPARGRLPDPDLECGRLSRAGGRVARPDRSYQANHRYPG